MSFKNIGKENDLIYCPEKNPQLTGVRVERRLLTSAFR
jgi:hypothetical protein